MNKLLVIVLFATTICVGSVATNTAFFSDASTVNSYISINYDSTTFTIYIAEGDNGDYNYIVEFNGSTDMNKFTMAIISCAEVSKSTTWSSDNIYVGFAGSGDIYILSTADARYSVNNVEARGGDWASSYVNERMTQTTYTPNSQERFTESNGIITDNQTNLQWRVGSNSPTDWYSADRWVYSLEGSWRLPSLNELRTLYNAGITSYDWGHFMNYGDCIWSNQNYSMEAAWFFCFADGSEVPHNREPASNSFRAFAVRSR